MKKVFMILIAAVLLLSMIGTVSAADTVITNITELDNATVPVILDLKNAYRVTIPAEIVFESINIDQQDPSKGRKYLATSQIAINVILLGANQNITVKISSEQYDDDVYLPAGSLGSLYDEEQGAWQLWNETSNTYVHYLISNSSSQITMEGKTSDMTQYKFTAGSDTFVYNGNFIADTNVSKTVPIHAALADVPKNTVQYTDSLKFVVNVTNS